MYIIRVNNGGNLCQLFLKCLNDWNAAVEALSQGKQTILIRKNRNYAIRIFIISYCKLCK